METFYYYIVLLGLCAFYTNASSANFKGSASGVKNLLTIAASLGFLSFFAIIVTSFFYITWWHSVLILIATSAIAGFTNVIGRIQVIGIVSVIGVLLFNYLAWSNMLNCFE